jgi:hypothetical protein
MNTFARIITGACLAAAACAHASPVIEVGTHHVAPYANQKVRIDVTGGQAVAGMNFMAQLPDGGPLLTDVDILSETIFAGNNHGLYAGSYLHDHQVYQGVVTASGTVSADGRIATLTFDADGLQGWYRLELRNDVEQSATDFTLTEARITHGWIHVAGMGDMDGDTVVDTDDLEILRTHFGQSGSWAQGDLDNNGEVDFADYVQLARHYGATYDPMPEPDTTVTPEPATMLLLLTGLGLGPAAGRRRV